MKIYNKRVKRTKENIIYHELIGLQVRVIKSTHKGYLISGKVIDETKNMIIIESNGIKKIPKNMSIFEFLLSEGETIEIEGKKMIGRPEDRIKNLYKVK
ncbi:MAG: ribonuclease P protein component 1 [Candidatus Jordarchaeum sp.]|uniref:ribonuclease P protein component 1 n=1 Tax=Candidatus Jordarchaeum sp. TaxID=2823881 RepID=UPI004049ACC8